MRTIELKCGCGAEIKLTDTHGDFYYPIDGGIRVFQYLIDKQAHEWLEIHKACTVAINSPPVIPINTQPYQTIPCYDSINHGGKANG